MRLAVIMVMRHAGIGVNRSLERKSVLRGSLANHSCRNAKVNSGLFLGTGFSCLKHGLGRDGSAGRTLTIFK